ncbi:hypothetical protein AMAG_13518 [Allomyces macrogynus ATCC 38327]|uniref:Uncharacterized protein n=1 Tax=Allomyces macrogynus (strain ATCC 38327) TaxID=578462 RepID=A0A0L0T2J8_ALLM3|nr:hypothetical protein AMAG_13518 [Allomyces macrogynus ATCC 38327]|eukprot:KNE68880.1 hypothetical protein AMAG_13518 [Allomyces macrogynus ATCC 38327]
MSQLYEYVAPPALPESSTSARSTSGASPSVQLDDVPELLFRTPTWAALTRLVARAPAADAPKAALSASGELRRCQHMLAAAGIARNDAALAAAYDIKRAIQAACASTGRQFDVESIPLGEKREQVLVAGQELLLEINLAAGTVESAKVEVPEMLCPAEYRAAGERIVLESIRRRDVEGLTRALHQIVLLDEVVAAKFAAVPWSMTVLANDLVKIASTTEMNPNAGCGAVRTNEERLAISLMYFAPPRAMILGQPPRVGEKGVCALHLTWTKASSEHPFLSTISSTFLENNGTFRNLAVDPTTVRAAYQWTCELDPPLPVSPATLATLQSVAECTTVTDAAFTLEDLVGVATVVRAPTSHAPPAAACQLRSLSFGAPGALPAVIAALRPQAAFNHFLHDFDASSVATKVRTVFPAVDLVIGDLPVRVAVEHRDGAIDWTVACARDAAVVSRMRDVVRTAGEAGVLARWCAERGIV